jgi:hypothetical protein
VTPAPRRLPRALGWPVVAVVVLAALVVWGAPFRELPNYLWRPRWKVQAGALGLLPLALAAWGLARAALTGRRRPLVRVSLVYALGCLLQLGFGLAEGRGQEGIRAKLVDAGHFDFVRAAVEQRGLLEVLTRHEDLIQQGLLGRFAPSKPPGTMGFYMVFLGLADALHRSVNAADRLDFYVAVLTVAWSLLPALVVFPLFGLARRFLDVDRAVLAAALLCFCPSMILVTMHTDQVLYPLLVATTLWLAVEGFAGRRLGVSALAGVVAYVAVFCSFGLLMLFPLLASVLVALAVPDRAWRPLRAHAAAFGAAFLATGLLARLALGYDVLRRYDHAIAYHVKWKGFVFRPDDMTYCAVLNTVEFLAWFGPAAAVLLLVTWKRSLDELQARRYPAWALVALGPPAVMLLLALFGRTAGEAARLWLFLVPSCALVVAAAVGRLPEGERQPVAAGLLALQFVSAAVFKLFQDFR